MACLNFINLKKISLTSQKVNIFSGLIPKLFTFSCSDKNVSRSCYSERYSYFCLQLLVLTSLQVSRIGPFMECIVLYLVSFESFMVS